MTNSEFSNEFDILASSYLLEGGFTMSDSSLYAFNEYEKSLFLTLAEEQYVLSLYNGKNSSGDIFESTEEMRRYLHNLVAEYYTDSPVDTLKARNFLKEKYQGMKTNASLKSTFFELPANLWFITYESVQTVPDETKKDRCNSGEKGIIQDVVPVTQDEFHRIKRNPFRGPSYRRALRLDLSDRGNDILSQDTSTEHGSVVEIVSKYKLGSYYVRYIRKVEPIILIDLPDPLMINGKTKACECQLHEAVHRNILELAVRLAIASRTQHATSKSKKDDD
jgi:hypothetical protein